MKENNQTMAGICEERGITLEKPASLPGYSRSTWQILCTSHSAYPISISRRQFRTIQFMGRNEINKLYALTGN